MPRSSKPRKKHRPKLVGRPVLDGIRDKLILPAHSALSALQFSDNEEALDSARHTLASLMNAMWVAAGNAHMLDRVPELDAGMAALHSLVERHERTGKYRCTGEELGAIRTAVNWMDQSLPLFGTHHLSVALATVLVAMDRLLPSEPS